MKKIDVNRRLSFQKNVSSAIFNEIKNCQQSFMYIGESGNIRFKEPGIVK